jgi:hypothetical protein
VVRAGHPISTEALHQIKQATRASFESVKLAHFDRISSGVCPPQAMMLFNDMSSALVAIAELCWSILGMHVRKTGA